MIARGRAGDLHAGGPVRAGDVGRLEPDHRLTLDGQVARTGDGRQFERVRHTDGGARLGRGEGLQTDPVGQVGVQTAQLALFKALRREQHVHLQRPADAADLQEDVDEVGLGHQHLGELVDADEQRGQRVEIGAVLAHLLVVPHVLGVGGGKQLLTPVDLTGDGVLHPVDLGQVAGQVGDVRGDVRRGVEALERRTTLEVDQDHVQRRTGVHRQQGQHQGAQELGLTGTGRADAQAVRAHALHGRFLDVQFDQLALLADTEGHPVAVPHRARAPGVLHVEGHRVAGNAQQFQHARVGHQRFLVTRVLLRAHPVRGQPPRQRLGLHDGQSVRGPEPLDAARAARAEPVGFDDHAQAAPLGQVAQRVGQVEQGDADQALLQDDVLLEGDVAVVDHDHDVRLVTRRRGVAGEPLPVAQELVEPVLDLAERAADHPEWTDAVHNGRMLVVRQPLRPLPLLLGATRGHHRDQQVVRGVEGGHLGDRGAGQRTHLLLLALQADGGETAQRDGHRQVGHDGVGAHEAAQRQRGDRLQFLDRTGLRRHQAGVQPLGTAADAQVQEVTVGGAPLPHPAAGRDRPQRLRIRVHPLTLVALLQRCLAGALAHLAEVAQVVLAVLVHLGLLGAATTTAATAGQHGDRAHEHHAAGDDAGRRLTRLDHEQHHDRGHTDHQERHDLHEHAARDDPGYLGRRFQVDLATRTPRRGQSRQPLELQRAHRRSTSRLGIRTGPTGRHRTPRVPGIDPPGTFLPPPALVTKSGRHSPVVHETNEKRIRRVRPNRPSGRIRYRHTRGAHRHRGPVSTSPTGLSCPSPRLPV